MSACSPHHRREFCIAPLLPMEGGGQELCGREDGRGNHFRDVGGGHM